MLKNIKVLLWDLDGTLYRPISALSQERWKVDVEIVSEKLHISYKKAEKMLLSAKEKYKSTTTSMSKLGCGTELEVLNMVESKIDRVRYLSSDPQLVQLFYRLVSLRHFIFSNILTSCIPPVLVKLGLATSMFEGFITTEENGLLKPDPRFFEYALKMTKLKPEQHLVVGDRLEVDLAPAAKFGMKTCLVWGESDLVDISIPEVYLLSKYLT